MIYDARALKCFIFFAVFLSLLSPLSLHLFLSLSLAFVLREHFTFPRANCDCACLLLPHLINLETLSHSFISHTRSRVSLRVPTLPNSRSEWCIYLLPKTTTVRKLISTSRRRLSASLPLALSPSLARSLALPLPPHTIGLRRVTRAFGFTRIQVVHTAHTHLLFVHSHASNFTISLAICYTCPVNDSAAHKQQSDPKGILLRARQGTKKRRDKVKGKDDLQRSGYTLGKRDTYCIDKVI